MTRLIPILTLLLIVGMAARGQDSRPANTPRTTFISLDIGRIPLNWLFISETIPRGSFVNIEPGVLWQQRSHPRQFVQIVGGYTTFSNVGANANIRVSGQGAYLKGGIDHTTYGYLALLSNWQNSSQFTLPGSTFGPYTGQLETTSQTRFGLEGYASLNTRLGNRWRIRFMPRLVALLGLNTTPAHRLSYVPGAGLTLGNDNSIQLSGGLTVQLQYRVRPKITPSL